MLDLGSVRQGMQPSTIPAPSEDVDIADQIVIDKDKPQVVVELPDGSVTVSFGEAEPDADLSDTDFSANLAESLSADSLGTLAEDLLRGIDEDNQSRQDWIEERAEGLKLLALKIEKPSSSSSGMGAGVENTSRSRHTMLLEAVLRGQANASAELLPADGPVKITNKLSNDTLEGDELAQLLEDDFNYYLTNTASEYEPDTERMLFWCIFGGSGFKKVYRCPIRQRPVSEGVDAADLIVSNNATDLRNAERVTFVTRMTQATMKRMQHLKAYRDVDLGAPTLEGKTAVDEEKEAISGVTVSSRPEDVPFTIYECYCLIDVPGDEQKEDGELTGLPRPYKVTLDKTSRQILEIRRNWKEKDELERPRESFVKFSYVPGIGFYDLGLIHLMGNPTVAATALLRVMIDSGIFANFPGGLIAKSATKQNTLDLMVAPGSFAPVDTSGTQTGRIQDAVMNLPYHEPGPAIAGLLNQTVEMGQRVGSTAEVMVGEGRQDAPVGTTIALIEQSIKILNAVHKRLQKAQAKEFRLLRDLFREYPEDFYKFNEDRDQNWDKEKLLKALNDYNLVPKADPNTASHVQRIMRAQALYQMAKADPQLFQIAKVLEYVLRVMGIEDPASVTQEPQQQPPAPDPKGQAALIAADADKTKAAAQLAKVQLDAKNMGVENQNRDQDRSADLQIAAMKLKTEGIIHGQSTAADAATQQRQHAHEQGMQTQQIAADQAMQPPQPEQGAL